MAVGMESDARCPQAPSSSARRPQATSSSARRPQAPSSSAAGYGGSSASSGWTDTFGDSLNKSFRRLSVGAKSIVDDTVKEFQEKGVSGVLQESASDTAALFKEIKEDASDAMSSLTKEAKENLDSTRCWLFGEGEDIDKKDQHRQDQGEKRRIVHDVPRLEQLRKGMKVYRKGEPAAIVKVDYEVEPPSLVVTMQEDGREVGTVGQHVSLRAEDSERCLKEGVRIRIFGLKSRTDINGFIGKCEKFCVQAQRWTVVLETLERVDVRPANLSVLIAGVQYSSTLAGGGSSGQPADDASGS